MCAIPLLGRRKKDYTQREVYQTPWLAGGDGWRFSLKGSPRHYDDVKRIVEDGGGARVYFGEALTYERGAGVALWRVQAERFDWLPKLYEWWAEAERVEPIQFTFHLYLPNDLKTPVLDLRDHTPQEVEAFIKQDAPKGPVPRVG
jgi:hypothetical protein